MHKVYDKWPEIAENSYKINHDPIEFHEINNIVFAGMGGSGTVGDAFLSLLSQSNIHGSVSKGFHLPNTIDSNTLVVAISVSGNTVETLSILESIKNMQCKVVGFSCGGKMQSFCENNRIEFRKVPFFHSPRSSFPSFLYTILSVLESTIKIKKEDVLESINELQKLANQINSSNLTDSNDSLSLAKWISEIPLIYYPWGLQSAAIRFKNSLQENAKKHAMIEDVIESCHNGIVAWERKSNVQPILLQGKDDYIKTEERWKILKKYFNQHDIEFREVMSVEGSILSKIINLIYFLDYCSIYNAVLSKIDPSPIKSIDFIKRQI